ncbi:hypothetical protein [Caldimonas brevitalea]|uniref:Uncharacterized protein n=1 Tax=Caldimonas brevitalea TaxID=413882 RepID=A0A0G3BTI6_9BURK|nr:hypothetical protein [Caldimonas brevitalea]AKJ30706.1 hypothetical protein AAW51_4015 [Caldimonas brevitalea]
MSHWNTACLAAALGVVLPIAHAQPPAATPAPGASAPSTQPSARAAAPRPDGTYRSAFEGYPRYADEPVVSWKEANDHVGRIGGWRTYAAEAAGEQGGGHAGHGAAPASSGQTPPRAGTANTEKPFGQTEMTTPPKTAPKPSPAPAASQPAAPAGHSQHH